jgi:hypothetical protein
MRGIFPKKVVCIVAVFTAGCSKPVPRVAPGAAAEGQSAQPPSSSMVPGVQTAGPVVRQQPPQLPPAATPVRLETPPVTVLEGNYAANADVDSRLEIMSQLSDKSTPEAVRALGRLFRIETDSFLKTELLGRIADAPFEVETKLVVFREALAATQPPDIRQAAVAELDNLDDTRALTIWQSLQNDPDEGFRDRAADALERFRIMATKN